MMSLSELRPLISIPSHNPKNNEASSLAESFVDRLKNWVATMESTVAEDEQVEVLAFLPSGKAIRVSYVGYDNPSLVTLQGEEEETGRPCTLLAHQATVQLLVTIEKLPLARARRVIEFQI